MTKSVTKWVKLSYVARGNQKRLYYWCEFENEVLRPDREEHLNFEAIRKTLELERPNDGEVFSTIFRKWRYEILSTDNPDIWSVTFDPMSNGGKSVMNGELIECMEYVNRRISESGTLPP